MLSRTSIANLQSIQLIYLSIALQVQHQSPAKAGLQGTIWPASYALQY